MFNPYLTELEQEPFDGEEFVERLAWRVQANSGLQKENGAFAFDSDMLNSAFVDAIKDLKLIDEKMTKKSERLETLVKEEETQHWHRIAVLLEQNRAAFQSFQDLDSHINSVATKVVHLGDQLENVNTPRSRAVEAQRLMNHFAEFLSEGPLISEVFTDSSKIFEAADIIQKLHLIAQELPTGKFEVAKKKILEKYEEIENSLLHEFRMAHQAGDKDRMKEIALTFSHFQNYSQCVMAFIEDAQITALRSRNIFNEVVPLCMKSDALIREVFTNPDQVMAKFVITLFQGQLKDHIFAKLEQKSSPEIYLRNLYELYTQTNRLCTELQGLNLGSESQFLPKLTKQIFQQHLSSYISTETRCLKEKLNTILQRYYDSKGHHKRIIQTGGINEIRDKIQDVISSKANINIGSSSENFGGETFLSEEVAISLLQETKLAFRRCQMLSSPSEVHTNGVEIFDLLTKALLIDHLEYAIELGLQTMPAGGEVRSAPELNFFDTIQQSSSMVNLLDKLYNDSLVPLIISTPKHGECLQKKKKLLQSLEQKLDSGLDKALSAMAGHVRHLLSTEQKKNDFKPESDALIANATPVCQRVVRWISQTADKLRESLDGHNLESVFLEFGLRLHRVILDHLMKFEYNPMGAMAVICDVNEYRKCCVANFKQPLLTSLFDTLHTLCKLTQVSPENLKLVCSEQLPGLDRTVLGGFIQLRSDYKTAKLGNQLR